MRYIDVDFPIAQSVAKHSVNQTLVVNNSKGFMCFFFVHFQYISNVVSEFILLAILEILKIYYISIFPHGNCHKINKANCKKYLSMTYLIKLNDYL